MSRYDAFKYGTGIKYGPSTVANSIWALEIDWNDDGIYDSTNEGPRMVGAIIERGRDYFLSSSGDGFEPIQPGRASLVLSNKDGRFDAYNTSSPLYPNVEPGHLMRLRVRVGATVYSVFAGIIQNITPNDYSGAPTVTLECEDGLRWLQDEPVTTGIYQFIYTDAAINTILTAAKWPALWGTSLQNGMDPLDYWWAKNRSAYEEISSLVNSEVGQFFVNSAGALEFNNRSNSPASVLSLDQSQFTTGVRLSQPWEIQRNRCVVTAYTITAGSASDLWTLSGEMTLGPGETKEIFASFDAAINLISPVATTDYTAFSLSNGVGTNLTGNISVIMTAFADSAKLTITNIGSQLAYINLLKVRGTALVTSPISAQSVAAGYATRPRSLSMDCEWQQDANNPASFSSQLLTILNGTPALPTIEIDTRPDIQFVPDLFDPITINLARLNINTVYRVGKITHEWKKENGQSVKTTIKTEPYWTYPYWVFDTNNILDTSLLGW